MALFLQLKNKKNIFENMAILEKIASHILSFEKNESDRQRKAENR